MTSLVRYATKAVKIPAGRKFLAQPDQQFLISLNYGPYCFQKSDIDSLVSSGFRKVSDSLYIAKTQADLHSVLTSLNNLNNYHFEATEHSCVDLGKTIRIGVAGGDNDIITMRLIKRTGNLESAGGPNHFPNVCYVVTGNRAGEAYNHALYCCILGTTPNNRSRKPFLNNGGYNPLFVPTATFESILSSVTKVSDSLYLANNIVDLSNNVLNPLLDSDNYVGLLFEISSIDMGKTIRVGITGVDNDLLVFRLIKRTGTLGSLGEPISNAQSVGYVCIANKVYQSSGGAFGGAAEPDITGSTPNALEVKPQFFLNCGYEPAVYTEANLESILSDCVKVSKSLYLANNATQLSTVCSTMNSLTGRDRLTYNTMASVDMGRTLRIGIVGGETDLITFGYTRGQSDLGPTTDLTSAYTVVASKLARTYHEALYPAILGSSPRDS